MGDSKTAQNVWQDELLLSLQSGGLAILGISNLGVSGRTVATTLAATDAMLAATNPLSLVTDVLINLGVNEMDLPLLDPPPGIDPTVWKAQYTEIIDKVHVKWPQARIWLMTPWRRGFEYQASVEKTWITDVVAGRPGVAYLGPDEAVWLKGGDDGVTNTTDGIHYSAAGKTACAAVWKTALGY